MSSLVNTKDRAMALEVRGFNARNKKDFSKISDRTITSTKF